jgi:hypothetical protein
VDPAHTNRKKKLDNNSQKNSKKGKRGGKKVSSSHEWGYMGGRGQGEQHVKGVCV